MATTLTKYIARIRTGLAELEKASLVTPNLTIRRNSMGNVAIYRGDVQVGYFDTIYGSGELLGKWIEPSEVG